MALPKLPSSASISSLAQQRPPAGTARPLVEYVLLAEFDIDQGSVLKHQYPAPTGCDDHLLAEHMLPDGAHDRQEDWTVFYLNQVPGLTCDPSLLRDTKGKGKAVEGGEGGETEKGGKGEGLLYVMSLVRTKKDATVRRGALVKALAVATRNPYIQIFKPILLLALESYFSTAPTSPDGGLSVLSNLYNSLNTSLDLSTLPLPFFSLDERTILRTSDRKDLFEEKFLAAAASGEGRAPSALSYAGSATGSGENGSTPSQPPRASGESDRAEVLVSSPVDAFGRSPSLSSLSSFAGPPSVSPSTVNGSAEDLPSTSTTGGRSRAGTISSLDDSRSAWSATYSPSMPPPPLPNLAGAMKSTTSLAPGGQASKPKDTHWFETKVQYNGLGIPYSLITLAQTFAHAPPFPGPFHPHLHTSGAATPPLILLFNALVTGQRVVFLGHGQPAGKVAELVLAACALVSGCGSVLPGVEERAFPYTNLTNLDNLENVEGYIAGVCNPAFADRPSWWDVLCNIETGRIVVSKELKSPPAPAFSSSTIGPGSRNTIGRSQGAEFAQQGGMEEFGAGGGPQGQAGQKGKEESPDLAFMEEILTAVSAHYGESVIRARFTDYVARFVRLASRYEEETTFTTSIGFRSSSFNDGTSRGYGTQASLGAGIVGAEDTAIQKELQASAARIEAWMKTGSYKRYQRAFRQSQQHAPVQGFDLIHQISRLRQSKQLSQAEARLIYQTLATEIRSDEAVVALLAHLPSHFGGLLPLAFGFFHPSPEVRHHTLELFDSLSGHPTGRKFVHALNAFHRSAYSRLAAERDAALQRDRDQDSGTGSGNGRQRESTATPANPLAPPVPFVGGMPGAGTTGPPLPAKDW
ncbi:hypothetical protein JCM10213v2_003783 [Rhodosporidiobolus nylandii]